MFAIGVPPAQQIRQCQVKSLTQEDIDSKNYSITDIVFPLFGTEVKFPQNKAKDFMDEILKRDGITLDCLMKVRPM